MKTKKYPFCSVIILSYYGEQVIETCLDSLLNLNYPKDRYEIIVVDNNSKDRTREILTTYAAKCINIRLFFLNKNLGFSRGNNIGIQKAKGEFVALLNNDCAVDKNWLRELVATANKDKQIFAVNSKILLYSRFINVRFSLNAKLVPVYAWLSRSKLYNESESRLLYLQIKKMLNYFEIEVPYEPFKDNEVELTILSNSRGFKIEHILGMEKNIILENKLLKLTDIKIYGDDIEFQIAINLSAALKKESLDKVQNAGIIVFQDGYGRDIGAIISGNKQYYEYDIGQYNKEREIYAACGAAVLYRKSILKKVGCLDEHFFMYYEDVEISERARFAGYKIVYSPQAVARHYHALFSKEWSPFFIYHVEKGRLLHIFYNFPFKVFLAAYLELVINSILASLFLLFRYRILIYKIKTEKDDSGERNFARRIQIIRALGFFIIYAPQLIIKKIRYSKIRKKEIMIQNYLKLLKGDWYFS